MIILGIDPGSRVTGFGVIQFVGSEGRYCDSGVIRLTQYDNLPQRLGALFTATTEVVDEYRPTAVAIERVFVNRNVASALKLGQARGAAISACVIRNLAVAEYSPTQIKQAIVGKGNATKDQVQYMISLLLGLKEKPQYDAADALAMALCHGRVTNTQSKIRKGFSRVEA